MPALSDIKKKIGNVSSTRKIAHSMKMVSTAKLRRSRLGVSLAQEFMQECSSALLSIRDYMHDQPSILSNKDSKLLTGIKVAELLCPGLFSQLSTSDAENYKESHEGSYGQSPKTLVLLFSPDRGLCGPLPGMTFKALSAALPNLAPDFEVACFGKKLFHSSERLISRKLLNEGEAISISEACLGNASEFISMLIQQVLHGGFTEIVAIYPHSTSIMSQVLETHRFFDAVDLAKSNCYPGLVVEDLVDSLYYAAISCFCAFVYYCLAAAQVSEHAARVMAMDNAYNNSGNVIKALSLQYNKIRQSKITREIAEIVAGAESSI